MPTMRKLVYYSYLGRSGFSPQLYSMKPCEIKDKELLKHNKRIGDTFGCDWRE